MIGDAIKKRRKEQKLSQAELAAKCGVTQSAISDVENNVTESPGINIVRAIANALNCKVDDFFNEGKTDTNEDVA